MNLKENPYAFVFGIVVIVCLTIFMTLAGLFGVGYGFSRIRNVDSSSNDVNIEQQVIKRDLLLSDEQIVVSNISEEKGKGTYFYPVIKSLAPSVTSVLLSVFVMVSYEITASRIRST